MEEHGDDDKYLFDINIKLVSESKDLDILISEWEQYKPLFDTIQEIKGRCICNRYIKYINYYYNKINGNIIMVGDTCKKKLKLKNDTEDENKYIKEIISKGKGVYKSISDIIDYNTDVLLQVMALITHDVLLTNGIENITKLLAILNKLFSINKILEKYKDFYDFLKCQIIILEDRKESIEEENKYFLEEERKTQELEAQKKLIKLQFEAGYYINIKIDKYTETLLVDYIKQQNNKYISKFIDIYKDNTYLYNKIKNILDNKLKFINLKNKEAEYKKKKEDALVKQNIENQFEKMKNITMDKYIRVKLGQKYPIPDFETNESDKRIAHLRFDFDADDNIQNNKYILNLFKEDFYSKKLVVHSRKGQIILYIISNIDYEKHNYWDNDIMNININNALPYETYRDYSGFGTVSIIKEIFYYILPKQIENEEKIIREHEAKLKEDEAKLKEEEYKLKEEKDKLKEEEYKNAILKKEEARNVELYYAKLKEEDERKIMEEYKKQINDKNIIDNIECACGLSKICKCKNPEYIIIKINKQLYCNYCSNWKCRC